MYCPVCGEEHTAPSTKHGTTWYCPNCLSIITTLTSNPDKKQKMPDWDPMNRPKCIYCGKSENVYRTEDEGRFYCLDCDTYFKSRDFPNCPSCNKNDQITIKAEGSYPHLTPSIGGPGQYTCHRCSYEFSDETLLYIKLHEDPDYDDEEESSSSHYDDIEFFGEEFGEDNPSD